MKRPVAGFCLTTALLLFSVSAVVAQSEGVEFVQVIGVREVAWNPIYTFTATEAQLYTAIYEGLVSYDPETLEPLPAVAGSWDVLEAGRLYRFHLRDDAAYWNGDPVTASHFRDTWLTMIDPELETAYSFLFDMIAGAADYRKGNVIDPNQVGIYAVDDRTLEVRLAEPAAHFLKVICHHSFVPVHPDMPIADDWSGLSEILGNGAYKIDEETADDVLLSKNPHYWDRDSVAIDRLRFAKQDDPAAATRAFNQGYADWVSSNADYSDVLYPGTLMINPMFATSYYFVASGQPPFDDPQVRRALALLLPLEELRSDAIHFIPTHTLVPQIPYYPEVEGIRSADPDEALALLEEAGYPNGDGLPEIVLRFPPGEESTRIGELMAAAWQDALSVTVTLDWVEYPSYFGSLASDDYTVGTVSWIGDFADPLTFLQMWTSDSNLNDGGFADSEFDTLIDESTRLQGRERYGKLAEAESLLLETAVVIPVSHSPALNLIDLTLIDGWHPNPLDIHPYKHLDFLARRPAPGVAFGEGGRTALR